MYLPFQQLIKSTRDDLLFVTTYESQTSVKIVNAYIVLLQ